MGQGTLQVEIVGLPSGVSGRVTVRGPNGFSRVLSASQTLQVGGGPYRVEVGKTASPVTETTLVRAAYAGTSDNSETCVRNNQTARITVTYSQIPSSASLWIENRNPPSGASPLLGFAASLLGSTSTQSPTVNAGTISLRDIVFDQDGNLWGIGGTTADPHLVRYPARDLGSSGPKTRDRGINIAGISCLPTRLAFDLAGNLWVSFPCADRVVRLNADQLGASGTVTPVAAITGLPAPQGLAFDRSGNLWIADQELKKVLRFNASRLGASTSGPDLTIESSRPGGGGTLDTYLLAFDAAGNLWVGAFAANILYRLTPADQDGSGSKTLTPAIQISVTVSDLLEGMAFDEGGGLWITYSAGKFARLSPSQLTTSSSPGSPTTPERIITSPSIGSAGGLALYPAPAGLPLFHSLP
ncbi:hypothetical protein EWH23_14585 [Meiothermus sp. PNK-Is4]|nr:hypothetical protein DNA98_16865 [Meiothermus sp. Pnk-1]RYM31530.1 hypothetical protein EWH23_14585 [Meiothermus sp. PNK-Is4]